MKLDEYDQKLYQLRSEYGTVYEQITSLQIVKSNQPNEIVISLNVSVSTATKIVSIEPGAKSKLHKPFSDYVQGKHWLMYYHEQLDECKCEELFQLAKLTLHKDVISSSLSGNPS